MRSYPTLVQRGSHTVLAFAAALALAGLASCDNTPVGMPNDGSTDDADVPIVPDLLSMPDLFVEGPPPPLPQIVNASGTVLSHPNLVTVSFTDTTWSVIAESFGAFLPTSAWLPAVGAEYGVTGMTNLPPAELAMKAPTPLNTTTFAAFLNAQILAGNLPSPVKYTQLMYMVYFPYQSVFNLQGGSGLCAGMQGYVGGFHGTANYTLNKKNYPYTYGVIGDCDGSGGDTSYFASHEFLEACTDPYLNDGRIAAADGTDPWIMEAGQEVGDMCEWGSATYEGGFKLSRIWSNMAAAADLDPCVPGQVTPYQNTFVEPREMPTIAAGSTMTFEIIGWSTAISPPWTISLSGADNSYFNLTEQQPILSSTKIGQFGKVSLTLTAPARGQSGWQGGLLVRSGPDNHPWPVAYYIE